MKLMIYATMVCMLAPSLCRADYLNVYSVGNSLSGDLRSQGGVEILSSNELNPIRHDYHVKCGSSLTSIVANPTVTCLPPLRWGMYSEAFSTTKLDVVTLQPFQGATIRQEVESIRTLVSQLRNNPLNANARVYIYATAPYQSEGPFLQSWNRQGLTLDSQFVASKQTYDLILSEVQNQFPEVRMLPAAHIMAALAERMAASPGSIPGLTSAADFYRDDIHASNTGRFVEGIALYSSVYGKSSEGLPLNWTYTLPNFGHTLLDPVGIREVQRTAWEVSQMYGAASVPEPGALALVIVAAGGALARRSLVSRRAPSRPS